MERLDTIKNTAISMVLCIPLIFQGEVFATHPENKNPQLTTKNYEDYKLAQLSARLCESILSTKVMIVEGETSGKIIDQGIQQVRMGGLIFTIYAFEDGDITIFMGFNGGNCAANNAKVIINFKNESGEITHTKNINIRYRVNGHTDRNNWNEKVEMGENVFKFNYSSRHFIEHPDKNINIKVIPTD